MQLKNEKGATELCAYEIQKAEKCSCEIIFRHSREQNKSIRSLGGKIKKNEKNKNKNKQRNVVLPVRIAIER